MFGNVRGAAYLVLVAGDENAVLRHHEVGLYIVSSILDGDEVRCKRVLGHITAGTAVADNNNSAWLRLGRMQGGD